MKTLSVLIMLLAAMQSHEAENLMLPELLTTADGKIVDSYEDWQNVRRPEILELFRKHVYGRTPIGRPADLRFVVRETEKNALAGAATRKQVDIEFSGHGGSGTIHLLMFVPNNITKPVPMFLLLNNRGTNNTDPIRETISPFWPAEEIIARGYAAAVFQVSDLDPDKHDGFRNGVHGIFDSPGTERPDDAWGTIAAWAWGASRVMDYFESDSDIDGTRVAVAGHSRGGKAALWAGAEDERFALVISNNSGCTGAALARRKAGERIIDINETFPHWFCTNYKDYNDNEDALPVDQHMLIALMAPRLVYVASATEDEWADPEGEFLACVHAEPVYRLSGLGGFGTSVMPEPDQPVRNGRIGYHIRTGKHNLTEFDWKCYMDFADKHWNE